MLLLKTAGTSFKLDISEHVAVSNVYNEDYHMFYTKTGWNAETDCLKGSGGLVDPQCCGADDGPKAQSSIIFYF